jgi:dTMP kinase
MAANTDEKPEKRRGALIVFEGLDRAGKTTQSHKAREFLEEQGEDVALVVFPDRETDIGRVIGDYLQTHARTDNLSDEAVHLLFAANRWEHAKMLRAMLAKGTTVIMDRYAYSGVAYSTAKGLEWDWCRAADAGLPKPDAVIFLDLSLDEQSKRAGWGKERFERTEFQEHVARAYNAMRADNWRWVDASQDVQDVTTDVLQIVRDVLARVRTFNKPIGKLW